MSVANIVIGEKLSGSAFKRSKFGNCCSSGQLSPHFELGIHCRQCNFILQTKDGEPRHPLPLKICPSCGLETPKVLPTFANPAHLLQELLTSNSRLARHFRKYIRSYNGATAMASVRANFVSRGVGPSSYSPTVAVHGRMYHEVGALLPPNGVKARFASVCIHDTDHAIDNRKLFFSQLKREMPSSLADMLESNKRLVRSFISLRDLMNRNGIRTDVKLVNHAYSKAQPGHERKYNTPEASEVAALIVGEQHGKLDIVLRRRGQLQKDGGE